MAGLGPWYWPGPCPSETRRPHTNSQLAEDEIAALRAEARERRVSMSRIVDEAVGAFCADQGPWPRG